jgi:hypothetical protein
VGRYRKVYTCLWGDAKFLSLSRPQPNGQSLWVYLLTGDATTNIPGLIPIGEGGLADALQWTVKGVRKAWAEIAAKEMASADWEKRLIFIHRAIYYNEPESPNVVRSWKNTWKDLPECKLKIQAYEQLKAYCDGLSEGFREAFNESCPKPFVKASVKASRRPSQNQEQDQEQL